MEFIDIDVEKICATNPGISEIVVPEGVTTIGEYAFKDARDSLKKVVLPSTIKEIKDYAFYECTKLSEINFPESLETIGYSVFYKTALTELVINKNIKLRVDSNGKTKPLSLSSCPELKKVTILAPLYEFSFRQCEKLEEIVFPEGIDVIYSGAFWNCKNIKKITIPNTVKEIQENAFSGCTGLEEVILNEGLEKICSNAFQKTNIKNIKLPSTLKYLSGFNCSPLESIELPDGLEIIGSHAFSNCENLKEIKLPSTIKTIENNAFYKTSIEKIEIPEGVNSIGDSAFENCLNLKEIKLPSKIEYSTKVEKTYSGSERTILVGGIAPNIFINCKKLEKITLPEGLKEIKYHTFEGCENLKEIYIPESVEAIKEAAFYGCKSLKQIILPKNLKSISSMAFCNCASIEKFDIPNCEFSYSNSKKEFEGCDSLKEISIGIKEIPTGFFMNAKALEKINFKNDIEYIGDNAFTNCESLKEIKISKTVNFIGDSVFENCNSLEKIDFEEGNYVYGFESGCLYKRQNKRLIRAIPIKIVDGKRKYKISEKIREFGARSFSKNVIDSEIEFTGKIKKVNDKAVDTFYGESRSWRDPKPNLDKATGGALAIYNSDKLEIAKQEKVTQIKAAGVDGLINAAFEEWDWGFEKKSGSSPARTVLKVNLPYNAAFAFNLSSKITQKDANFVVETMPFINEAKGDGTDSYVNLFDKIRKVAKNCEEEIKSGNNKINKITFQNNRYQDPFSTAGIIDEIFIKEDLKRLFKGSNLEYQYSIKENFDYQKNKSNPNVKLSIKKGDFVAIYSNTWESCRNYTILEDFIKLLKETNANEIKEKFKNFEYNSNFIMVDLSRLS